MFKRLTWLGISVSMLGGWGCGSASEASPDLPAGSGARSGTSEQPRAGAGSTGSGSPYPSAAAGTSAVGMPNVGSGGSGTNGPSGAPGEAGEDADEPGDRYDDPGTNAFVSVAHDPLSTFAADADTASYDIFRRDVGLRTLPDESSVRLEEYINSFDYDYPAPDEDSPDPFAIHLAAAPALYDAGTLLLRVGIQGKQAPSERGPANLVFLVDVSGSMQSEDKLPLVKLVLTEALDVLEPEDTVAVVTYAGSTAVLLQPTPVSQQASIEQVIAGLDAGGSTAGGAGLSLAYAQARAGFREGGINHIVMCTDGDFNVGLSSDQELLGLVERERTSGVTLTTLGFGSGNLNDSMMEKVSDAGNGMYSVIANPDQAIDYVNDRLLSTMIHIAKDMKIQVEFNPEHVEAYRLLGYENRAIADEDFRDDVVDAGEVGAGHQVTALYEVVPRGVMVPAPEGAPELEDGSDYDGAVEVDEDDLVLVKVRYKEPSASESDEAKEVASSLAADGAGETYEELDADFRWAFAVATFAEILKQSPYARPEALEGVELILSNSQGSAADRSEFNTLFDLAKPLLAGR
jgi:Ca-activated chloride channel homolog